MKAIDRYLQSLRIRQAARWIPAAAQVLDIGCSEGEMFQMLAGHIAGGVGIDPGLQSPRQWNSFKLQPGCFPDDLDPSAGPFDAITALAVVEHVPMDAQPGFARACAARLKPGGRLILTIPSPQVDAILDVLLRLRLIHGMSLEEHSGFEAARVPEIYAVDGLRLLAARRFELGLNNLFVFEKS